MRKLPIVGPDPYTPEWYALRRYDPDRVERPVVFGASEASIALGVNPYCSVLELYLRKRCEIADIEDNTAMMVGRALEPVVLDLYAKREGVEIKKQPSLYLHPEYSFMAATPDAIRLGDQRSWERPVDAKATTFRRYDRQGASQNHYGIDGSDQLPIDLMCQAQQQMEVLCLEMADFPVLFDVQTLRVYSIRYEGDLVVAIAKAEKELAERIVNADPPEPNWCLEGTSKLISGMFGYTPGKSVALSAEAVANWRQYKELGKQVEELEKQKTHLKNRILYEMQDCELADLGDGKELRRLSVPTSRITMEDVEDIAKRVGDVKREGYEKVLERKKR